MYEQKMPEKREDCAEIERPCPHFLCKYNISLDVLSLKKLEHYVETGEFNSSLFFKGQNCLLDIVDDNPGGLSNYEIGDYFKCSKETIRLSGLTALTKTRSYFSGLDFLQEPSYRDPKQLKLEEFIKESFSLHLEDIESIQETYPNLSVKDIILLADDLELLDEQELDVEYALSIYDDPSVAEIYDLSVLPNSFSVEELVALLPYTEDMVEGWISRGMEFYIDFEGNIRIERGSILQFLEIYGQYVCKIKQCGDPDSIDKLAVNFIGEINDDKRRGRKLDKRRSSSTES